MSRIVEKSLTISRTAVSTPDARDFKRDAQVAGLIREVVQTVQGNQVSTAGGAISGFTREAPWTLISLIDFSGPFLPRGGLKRQIISAPPADLYWPSAFLQNAPPTILTTSAGASSTDPIRGVLGDLLRDNHQEYFHATYIDSRGYSSLDYVIRWGATADLAATNLSSTSSMEMEVRIREEIGHDLPMPDEAHFEPAFILKQHPTTTSGTQVSNDNQVTWDGLAITYMPQQHDDSQTGNSQRQDGLVKFFKLEQAGNPAFNNIAWQSFLRLTQQQYPLALTTTQPAGVGCAKFKPAADSRNGAIIVIRDTSSTAPVGITGQTPAASDRFDSKLLVVEPNAAMDEVLVV